MTYVIYRTRRTGRTLENGGGDSLNLADGMARQAGAGVFVMQSVVVQGFSG